MNVSVDQMISDMRATYCSKGKEDRRGDGRSDRRWNTKERNRAIADEYVNSLEYPTYEYLATKYGVTRQRIEQIIRAIYPGYKRKKKPVPSREDRKFWRTKIRTALFWSLVAKGGEDECWLWQGSCHIKTGYGLFRFSALMGRAGIYAHRVSWTLANGKIPAGIDVLHSCDNPPCCNPAHLWLGTQADNNADRDRKGRTRWHSPEAKIKAAATRKGRPNTWSPRGSKHHNAKLTEEKVTAIRSFLGSGERVSIIAKKYWVTVETIYSIRDRRTWRHIP